jgi:hypothetical protein
LTQNQPAQHGRVSLHNRPAEAQARLQRFCAEHSRSAQQAPEAPQVELSSAQAPMLPAEPPVPLAPPTDGAPLAPP